MSYYERTYGEINDIDYLYQVIKKYIKITENYYFYDFGSGYGKICTKYHNKFKKCFGIEIDKDRHNHATILNDKNNVIFINKNFFDIEIDNNPTILFSNNMCFGKGTLKRFSYKINNELKKGDLLILTKKLDFLENYYKQWYSIECSWGNSEIYVYEF